MGLLRRLRTRLTSGRSGPVAAGDTIPPTAPKRLVVGLGNPGPQYAATRHNVGCRVVEVLAERWGAAWTSDAALRSRLATARRDGREVALLRPETFMNRSGQAVAAALDRWSEIDPACDLLVVHDDLDLPLGRVRLRPRGGSGGHRGIGDVIERVGSRDVPRLRVGIGHPGRSEDVLDWVLAPFPEHEERDALPAALARAADAVEAVLAEGLTAAMGRFNAVQADPSGSSAGSTSHSQEGSSQ